MGRLDPIADVRKKKNRRGLGEAGCYYKFEKMKYGMGLKGVEFHQSFQERRMEGT